MGYAVLHMEKAGGSDSGMSAHIERTVAPKNADANRTHLNREMIIFPDGVTNRTEAIQHRLETAGLQRKIGKNQVRAVRILLTGSPDDMKRIEQAGMLDDWCRDNLDWLKKTYGADNIVSAVLHLDETTPHIHATMIPIVTGERRKARAEQVAGKKKYRKKSTDIFRLCADDVMSRVRLKEYQNSYAEQMAKYGLQRGVDGSEAKHVTTTQYYRDLLIRSESVQANITQLLDQKLKVEQKLSKVKADVSKEKLKNSAADVGSKLMDGVCSLLGTPKMNKIEAENKELRDALHNLYDENKQMRQSVEIVKSKALKEIENFGQQFRQREQELITENKGLKTIIAKLSRWHPITQEMLRLEKLCKTVGFVAEQVNKLMFGHPIQFSGFLYSEEHKQKFTAENSVAKVTQDKENQKLYLIIDGKHIADWFKLKYQELKQSVRDHIKLPAKPEVDRNKGIKI